MVGRHSLSLTLTIHGTVPKKSNARKAQSLIKMNISGKVQQLTSFQNGCCLMNILCKDAGQATDECRDV